MYVFVNVESSKEGQVHRYSPGDHPRHSRVHCFVALCDFPCFERQWDLAWLDCGHCVDGARWLVFQYRCVDQQVSELFCSFSIVCSVSAQLRFSLCVFSISLLLWLSGRLRKILYFTLKLWWLLCVVFDILSVSLSLLTNTWTRKDFIF